MTEDDDDWEEGSPHKDMEFMMIEVLGGMTKGVTLPSGEVLYLARGDITFLHEPLATYLIELGFVKRYEREELSCSVCGFVHEYVHEHERCGKVLCPEHMLEHLAACYGHPRQV